MQKHLIFAATLLACSPSRDSDEPPVSRPLDLTPDTPLGTARDLPDPDRRVCWQVGDDLADVVAAGVLRVALPNDSTSWFLHRGEVMGFEYTVLEHFADANGLDLEVVRIPSVQDRHTALRRGDVDAIAGRLAALDVRGVRYSAPLARSTATVLQPHAEASPLDTATAGLIVTPEELAGRRVHALRNAGWAPTLDALDAEAVPVSDRRTTEHLGRMVAGGTAAVAIGRADVARRTSRPDDVFREPTLDGETVGYHVAFRSTAPDLAHHFEDWLDQDRARVDRLYDQHFAPRVPPDVSARPVADGVSPYDDLFVTVATENGWDWHLLAAQAFQESRFRPRARSWAGARGLMQLMPRTARELGVADPYDPEQAVTGAVDYLLWLDDYWLDQDVDDDTLRLRLVLASYNAGVGHVGDARRFASATGGDPDAWPDIAAALIALRKPANYRHPVVRYGYVRGTEPVAYVDDILRRARHYRALSERG
jgi:membrane-bound lytic murein transglycosylase F